MFASIASGCHCGLKACHALCAVPDAPRGHSPQALRMAPVPLNTGKLHQCNLIWNTLLAVPDAHARCDWTYAYLFSWVSHCHQHDLMLGRHSRLNIAALSQDGAQSVVALCRLAIEKSLGRLMCNAASGQHCFVTCGNNHCAEDQTAVP